ncbi:MAG: protein arginine kinase [candidate division Zixibacteria bacterium]|nr:protein arginine kinase [candidate division Zixibacteria bacterium]
MFEDMIKHPTVWLQGDGSEAEIVLSSRVRMARNISGLRYPPHAPREDREKVLEYATRAIEDEENKKLLRGRLVYMDDIDSLNRNFLVERHLVSPEFMQNLPSRGLFIGADERICIMVNEEDHLRIQAITSGLAAEESFDLANKVDDSLSKMLEFDFDADFGYLTSCPTNVGTGLRASVLIHLPGLVLTRDIDSVISRITKLGLAVRGFYGEGTDVSGNLFQVSNQTTLGRTEADIIDSIQQVTDQIIEYENAARERLFNDARMQIEDKIWRAYGILKNARVLSSEEVMNLLSAVRLGYGMGVLKNIELPLINELLLLSRSAHLQKLVGKDMDSEERDIARADLVREKLSGI